MPLGRPCSDQLEAVLRAPRDVAVVSPPVRASVAHRRVTAGERSAIRLTAAPVVQGALHRLVLGFGLEEQHWHADEVTDLIRSAPVE